MLKYITDVFLVLPVPKASESFILYKSASTTSLEVRRRNDKDDMTS